MAADSIDNCAVASSSRRTFLKFTASAAIGGGFVLGFGLSRPR
jgi:hypothetical protein